MTPPLAIGLAYYDVGIICIQIRRGYIRYTARNNQAAMHSTSAYPMRVMY
jgi:hypothetical protein